MPTQHGRKCSENLCQMTHYHASTEQHLDYHPHSNPKRSHLERRRKHKWAFCFLQLFTLFTTSKHPSNGWFWSRWWFGLWSLDLPMITALYKTGETWMPYSSKCGPRISITRNFVKNEIPPQSKCIRICISNEILTRDLEVVL